MLFMLLLSASSSEFMGLSQLHGLHNGTGKIAFSEFENRYGSQLPNLCFASPKEASSNILLTLIALALAGAE